MSILNKLISPADKQEAATMGLLQLASQLSNRGAPRLTPTPPPIDLAGPLNTYRQGMNAAMQRGMMARQLEKEQALKSMFTNPKLMSGIPKTVQPFIQQVGANDPASAISMAGNILANQYKYRKPTFKNVEVEIDGKFVPKVLSTTQIAGLNARGIPVRPYDAPPQTILQTSGTLQTEVGKNIIKGVETASGELGNAISLQNDANQLLELLNQGTPTGFGQETILDAKKLAARLGFDVGDLSGQELFGAITTRMTLPLVKTLGVNPTDKDLDFVIQGQAHLTKTPKGNKKLLAALVEKQRRVELRAKFNMKFYRDNIDLLQTNPMKYEAKRFKQLQSLEDSFKTPAGLVNQGGSRVNTIGNAFSGRGG